jgi:tetrahydromethanopterin S-methyltransferase subunit G
MSFAEPRQELTGAEEVRERFTEKQNRLEHINAHMSERCGRVVARPM